MIIDNKQEYENGKRKQITKQNRFLKVNMCILIRKLIIKKKLFI